MKKLINLAILFFTLSQANLYAQQHINIMNAFNHYKLRASENYNKLAFHVRSSVYKEVIGNTYSKDWEEAILIIDNQEIYSVKARHRLFDDELQILLNGQVKALYPHLMKGVAFRDRSIVSGTEEKENGLIHRFYTLLCGGSVELLRKETIECKIREGNVFELGKKTTGFYFRKNEEYVQKLNTSLKKLLNIFGDRKDEVKAFIRQNRLSTESEEDLKAIFQFYNQLE
ncbi:MAG: hypothetical protein AAF849_04305 [Bacteroidota bacterium]